MAPAGGLGILWHMHDPGVKNPSGRTSLEVELSMRVEVAPRHSPLWRNAAELVRDNFSEAFAASVMPDPDAFAVLHRGGEEVLACTGLSFDDGGPFFCERYLDGRIEDILTERLGVPVLRDQVIQVGSLASRGPRAAIELLRAQTVILWGMGHRYALMTATRKLASLLSRLGYSFIPLAEASAQRLTARERERWGSYYDNDPRTGAVVLDDEHFSRFFAGGFGKYLLTELDVQIRDGGAARSAGDYRAVA